MATKRVFIIATGVANIASMKGAFHRLGCETVLTEDPESVQNEQLVVLPGVGAFAAGIERLQSLGLVEVIQERCRSGRPLLAVCLGLQLLFRSSEESAGVEGLSVFNDAVSRFDTSLRIPQLGWNSVEAPSSAQYLESGHFYFANSFCVRQVDGASAVASSNYGHPFVAAFERAGLLACQFHPELSGVAGATLLGRWVNNSVENF
jgi:imidazole glycerol phosphate synthase glutamine amidotransferase subunit